METKGLILLNKPVGLTSFEALRGIKKALDTDKIGHTGTLDKFAQGLLLVLVGRGLKLAFLFNELCKGYEATVKFGEETATLDPEGAVICEAAAPSLGELERALPAFQGEILQVPPAYSAVHVKGARASALARKGTEFELPPRPVHIYELALLDYQPPYAKLRVFCSKGTYIRALARDLALAAGSRAHLVALTRTDLCTINPKNKQCEKLFSLKDAVSLYDNIPAALHPLDSALFTKLGCQTLIAPSQLVSDLIHGKPLTSFAQYLDAVPIKGTVGIFDEHGAFVGVIEKTNNKWQYKVGASCAKI